MIRLAPGLAPEPVWMLSDAQCWTLCVTLERHMSATLREIVRFEGTSTDREFVERYAALHLATFGEIWTLP